MDRSDDGEHPAGHEIECCCYAIPVKIIFYHIPSNLLVAKLLFFFDLSHNYVIFQHFLIDYLTYLIIFS